MINLAKNVWRYLEKACPEAATDL